IQGYRMRLHFDGYSECYDFWVNADSPDIHPVGWCEKTGHKLLPPKGCKEGEFNWASYLKNSKAQAAPKTLFKALSTPITPSGFRLGMKLEAVDKKNPSLMCVATITDMVDNRLLIHFDNWDESYDYWCDASSPYIRPVGYCQETGTPLTTPAEYKDFKSFSWEKYLEETGSQAAPARAFKLRPAHGFQANMKLEVVDKRNPMLIRVATITDKDDYRLKIHFDGWDPIFDFWIDADSPDIHPMGWCAKTGHPLQLPLGTADPSGAVGQGCPTPGCQGMGHVRGPRYGTHYTLVGCPYSEINRNRENSLQDRLGGERPLPNISIQKTKKLDPPVPLSDLQEDSPQSRKSSTQDEERSGRSSVHSLSEQSETSQEKDWTEPESSAITKIKSKRCPKILPTPNHRRLRQYQRPRHQPYPSVGFRSGVTRHRGSSDTGADGSTTDLVDGFACPTAGLPDIGGFCGYTTQVASGGCADLPRVESIDPGPMDVENIAPGPPDVENIIPVPFDTESFDIGRRNTITPNQGFRIRPEGSRDRILQPCGSGIDRTNIECSSAAGGCTFASDTGVPI
ncbi:UNVERIFIED_CONTAM: Lethal(3)malignant brain tumor-like protein 3, partial [Gekko kuhli]